MSEPNNGQTMTLHNSEAAQGLHRRTRPENPPKTYRAIVQLLADPSQRESNRQDRLSPLTPCAPSDREAQDIAERKKTLAAMLANVAELGASRMEETVLARLVCRRSGDRDRKSPRTRCLRSTGQTQAVRIANIMLPSDEERAERRRLHDRLDAIARRLRQAQGADAGV